MSNEHHGGPAFPRPYSQDVNGTQNWSEIGMLLRDYFAAKALPSTLSASAVHDGVYDYVSAATSAYMVADAMLAARSQESRQGSSVDLRAAAAVLCNYAEAKERFGDESVPERLKNLTDADMALAIHAVRVAIERERAS